MTFATCLIVMIGGALGSLTRYLLSVLMLPVSAQLPWGTILINIAGSFLIGLFGTLTLASGRYPVAENWRIFVMVGFCGGFSTFSTFSNETLSLLQQGLTFQLLAYVSLSLVLCVALTFIGIYLTQQA